MAQPSHRHARAEVNVNRCSRRVGLIALLFGLLLSACRVPAPCKDEAGCIVIAPDRPVVLGVLRAWLGEHASAGEQMLTGIQKAVEERESLLGHDIALHRAGSECNEESARLAATALLTDPDIFLLLGPTCADEINAIAPLLTDAGVFLVTPPTGEEAAYRLTTQILDILQQAAIQGHDGTLYLPRRDLQRRLQTLP